MERPLPDFGAGFTAGAVVSKDNAIALALGTCPSHPVLVNSENVLEMTRVVLDTPSCLGKGADFLPITFAHGDIQLTPEQLTGGTIFVVGGGPRTLTLPPIQTILNHVDAHKIPLSTAYADGVSQTFYKGVMQFEIVSSAANVVLRTPAPSLVAGHAGSSGYRSIKIADGTVANIAGATNFLAADCQPTTYTFKILLERASDGIVWAYVFIA